MGRETRQTRRQRQRRQQARHRQSISRLPIIGGTALIVAVIAVLGFLALHNSGTAAKKTATNQQIGLAKSIDGIGCGSGMEAATYHVHSHLDIYVNGKYHAIPPYIGFNINHDCLYWLHTHQPAHGIIHIEAPHHVIPTLGQFFDVWRKPLDSTHIWKYSVKPGEKMRIWVNSKPYSGTPQDIKLVSHKSITIEIGPPWVTPHNFDFSKLGL